MQFIESHALFFIGFVPAVLIPYIIARLTSRENERFTDCCVIIALGVIVEQTCALFFGIEFGNAVDFYLTTTIVFSPAVVLTSIDLIRQFLKIRKKRPSPITIDIK